ncbi:hypothetical protein GCM10027413_06010 [Conyzicola nivalis]|uniref:Uncharacterized protein n=1 Tax=Conyzicola nivalis TaxID=1477021 RepID=A0A916SN88_9MICO|nr:hypothetical protein [Conyzicola nivalis]GGB05809.1 hypothetical protein GCM10010979_20620 [Conyzicola nivalis]
MRTRLLPTSVVLALAASLALAGCTAGGGAGGGDLDPEKTPMMEYYDAMYGGYDEKEAAAQQKQVEELVSTCMADEGFDYTPVDQSQYQGMSFDDEDRDTEEWVAEHGYGMNQTPEEQEEMNAQAEDFVDPNQGYVEALSTSEQEAYYEVLYGPGPSDEEMAAMEDGDGSYEYDWKTAGCQGAAQHEITGDDLTQSEKYKPLMDEINSMWEKQQKAPAIVKLEAEWAACMADAGWSDFKKKEDAMNEVNEASNAYWEKGATEEPDDALKAEWREHEIEVALADFKCAEKVDYQNTYLAAQYEFENQFIADHKSELDAMVADIAQAKK